MKEIVAALLVVLAPSIASAQLSAGASVSVAPPPGTTNVRWPDVAHDPAADVYLAVSGAGNIMGQYVAAGGSLIGDAFRTSAVDLFGQAPRVTHGGGAFLVAWHETIGDATRIRGRLLRYRQPALTGDFDISPLGTNWEMGAATAYSRDSNEYLVVWQGTGNTIAAQRVSAAGALLGAPLSLGAPPRYHRDPAVTWSGASNEFVVAYGGCVADNDCFAEGRRVQAGTGAILGTFALDSGVKAVYTPELAYNPTTRQVLAVWHRRADRTTFQSRRINPDGTLDGPPFEVTARYTSYDANGLAYNAVSNTFLFVTHSDSASDVAIELGARGEPRGELLFAPATTKGNFNPRVVARGVTDARAEWLAVTSTEFTKLTAQSIATLTRDAPGAVDAGVADSAVDARSDAIPDTLAPADTAPLEDAGCGCTTGTRSPSAGMAVAFAAIVAWRVARRVTPVGRR